jgi:hypothetical protein
MQIPILRGVYTEGNDWRASYPVNMVPVPINTGISEGYLRNAEGIVQLAAGAGASRGGIVWNGVVYRVIGGNLVSISNDGAATIIGAISGTDRAIMDYGFDYLAICADGKLWLYDGINLAQVTDPDLGAANAVVWVDGYYMTTDGEFLVVTELNDPFAVNPLKYGSSEADPDPVTALLKIRNEVYALNRNTIEVFNNIGGTLFPFARVEGAQIQKGCIGRDAACVFEDALAFIGSGRNEPPAVYMGLNGGAEKISTRDIDALLATYTEAELATAAMQDRAYLGHAHLIIDLPRHTLVYDFTASQASQAQVWFFLASSANGEGPWAADSVLWAGDRWQVAHPLTGAIGYLTDTTAHHWGQVVGWKFATPVLYNDSKTAVVHDLEIVALTGLSAEGVNPSISVQWSSDGGTWSVPKWIGAGGAGTRKRIMWRGLGMFRNWRVFRFAGTSETVLTPTRLEATLEALGY